MDQFTIRRTSSPGDGPVHQKTLSDQSPADNLQQVQPQTSLSRSWRVKGGSSTFRWYQSSRTFLVPSGSSRRSWAEIPAPLL